MIDTMSPFVRVVVKQDIHDLAREWPLVFLLDLPVNSHVLVLGAFEGKVMELLATVYPHYGRIEGYEPRAEPRAKAQARLAHYRNMPVHPLAVTDDYDMLTAEMTDDDVYSSMMISGLIKPTVRVDTTHIEGLVPQPVDLMLMNVEGYEGRLLRKLHDSGVLASGLVSRFVVQFHEQYDGFQDVLLDMVNARYRKVYDDYPRWMYWKHRDA